MCGGAFLAQYPVEFECADCVLHVSIRTMETRLSIKSPFFGHSVLNSFSTTLKEGRSAESSAQQQPMSCKVCVCGGGVQAIAVTVRTAISGRDSVLVYPFQRFVSVVR